MKKSKIILIVLVVILAIVAAVVYWQFENIKSVYYWMTYSESDIENMVEKNNDELNKLILDNPKYNIHPTTPLEEKLYQDGIIDDEELTQMLTEQITIGDVFGSELELAFDDTLIISGTGEKVDAETARKMKEEAKQQNQTQTPAGSNQTAPNPSQGGAAESGDSENESSASGGNFSNQVSECIAQVYVLKSNFVGRLDSLYNQAINSYKALPEENREAGKQSIISSLYPQASAMEKECDGQMEQILSRLQSLLASEGEDTSIVGKIRDAYRNEKSLKKAYYLNQI